MILDSDCKYFPMTSIKTIFTFAGPIGFIVYSHCTIIQAFFIYFAQKQPNFRLRGKAESDSSAYVLV